MKSSRRITVIALSAIAAAALSMPSAMLLISGPAGLLQLNATGLSVLIAFATYFSVLVVGARLFTKVPLRGPHWLQPAVRFSVAATVVAVTVFALLLPYFVLVVACSSLEVCASSKFTQELISSLLVATLGASFWLAFVVVPVLFLSLFVIGGKSKHERLVKNAL